MSRAKLLRRQTNRIGVALALVLAMAALASFSLNPEDGRATAQVAPATGTSDDPPVAAAPAATSLMIVENAGQWDPRARFQVWGGPAGTMWLAEDAIWLTVVGPEGEGETSRQVDKVEERETSRQVDKVGEVGEAWLRGERREPVARRAVAVRLSFVGANPHPQIETYAPLDTKVSYFIGNDPEQWRPEVPVWGGVRYVDLYPGIDLVVGAADEQGSGGLWQLRLRDGGDPSALRLRVEGADAVTVEDGYLRLGTVVGEIGLALPTTDFIDQIQVVADDGRSELYNLPSSTHNTIAKHTSPSSAPADNPADLLYSTFLGGSGGDFGAAIAVDSTGSAYVAGSTQSSNFPTTPGTFDPGYSGGTDAFSVKLTPDGRELVYATFLGGSNSDGSGGIALDGGGSVYIAGVTKSSDFPVTPGAFDPNHGGGICGGTPCSDIFVAKLNPVGTGLTYATYLGGDNAEGGGAIVVDGVGAAYVAGSTSSSSFPTTPGAFDEGYNGATDGFVVKFNTFGSGLIYATFLGGDSSDAVSAIVVDEVANAFVTGSTNSANFPVTIGAFDTSYSGAGDGFVAKLSPTGNGLVFATFLGGSDGDRGSFIAVDTAGNTLVAGSTYSNNFPTTPNAFDRSFNGRSDGFVVKVNQAGSDLVFATYLGGNDTDYGQGIDVDNVGNVYVVGTTGSSNFPTTANAYDRSYNDGGDVYVGKLNSSGSALTYASFLGAGFYDDGSAIAVDNTGKVHVGGSTDSGNFPTTSNSFDPSHNGGYFDAYAAMLAVGGGTIATSTPTRTATATLPSTSTPTATATASATLSPTHTSTPIQTNTVTASPVNTSTPTATTTSAPPTATPPLATPTATPNFPVCTVTVDKIAYPSTARIDGQIGVTLRLTGDCPGEIGAAVDVALVIDRSQSMCGDKLTQAQAAGQAFLDNMALPPDQVAVISFAGTATQHSGLTTNRTQAGNALYAMACGGISRLDAGLNRAFDEMTGPRRVAGHTPAVILLTDGNPEGAYANDVRAAAQRLHQAGIQLYTVGLGADVNGALLREIATTPDRYYQSPTPADLAQVYARLAGELRQAPAANLNLTDVVAANFDIVPGSFTGAAQPTVNGQTLAWYIARLDSGSTEVSFAVQPRACGTFPVNQSAMVSYDDNRGVRRTLTFPVPTVTVTGCSGDLTDVFVRDNPQDMGPTPSNPPWWASPDIWIRHADDGGEQHQNPQAGQRNYLYARVLNRGTTAVGSITVTWYYGASGLGLGWPAGWTALSQTRTIASLAPGASAIVSIPWDVPSIAGHFCLRVHISAAADPIRDTRIAWENNIAQRNLHVIAYPQPPAGQCSFDQNGTATDQVRMDVINTLNTSSLVDVELTASGLPDTAQAFLQPGALANRWSSLDGLAVQPDGRLRVLRFPARLFGIRMNPGEIRSVTLEVQAPVNSRFTVGIAEYVRGSLVGGNSYQRVLPSCPVNLPLILRGPRCTGGTYTPPDVMLVMDVSGSMQGQPLAAAKGAAIAFVQRMDLSVEQAGVAAFASSAGLNHPLSRNEGTLIAAVNGLVANGNTAIGDGIAVAQAELAGPRGIPGHARAMVILSDGDNNAGQNPVTAANNAKQAGTVIFTIGLGSSVNTTLLRQIATSPNHYYFAPTPDDLEAIYLAIAGQVGCVP